MYVYTCILLIYIPLLPPLIHARVLNQIKKKTLRNCCAVLCLSPHVWARHILYEAGRNQKREILINLKIKKKSSGDKAAPYGHTPFPKPP